MAFYFELMNIRIRGNMYTLFGTWKFPFICHYIQFPVWRSLRHNKHTPGRPSRTKATRAKRLRHCGRPRVLAAGTPDTSDYTFRTAPHHLLELHPTRSGARRGVIANSFSHQTKVWSQTSGKLWLFTWNWNSMKQAGEDMLWTLSHI